MNLSVVRVIIAEARNCAMVLLENATFIQRELTNVRMSDALRAQTEEVCTTLIGTKHDIISELFELDEFVGSKTSISVISSRVQRILQWLRDDIAKMHRLVMALEAASSQDRSCISAYVLVAESAANILKAYQRTRTAASSLSTETDEQPNAYR